MKILVINGGGVRGVIPATALNYIEKQTGKKIHELFDLIVGTSTGGILTYGITLGNYTAETILDLYRNESKNIFKKRFLSFFNSQYPITGLESTINKYFKDFKLKDCKTKTITTGRDKLNKENLIFKSWGNWEDLEVKHAAISTAAAPDYFPTYEFTYKNKKRLVWDGGVFAANPAFIAQNEANGLGFSDSEIVMLNLGTGYSLEKGYNTINPNKLTLVKEITSDMLDSQSELVNYSMNLSLKNNYHYWDVEIETSKSDMADYQYIPYWEKEAQKNVTKLNNFINQYFNV